MASQTTSFLKGRIDNIIFFQRGGKFFARSMPDKVKQTPATKKRSRNFGIAASAGRILRGLLLPSLPFPKDKQMQSRFSGAIAKWLRLSDLKNLQPEDKVSDVLDFDFNPNSSLSERCKITIDVNQPEDGLIEVNMAAFVPVKKIIAPARTAKVIFTISSASCKLKNSSSSGSFTVTLEIPYNEDLIKKQTLSFPVGASSGNLVVTVISLRYVLAGNRLSENISFMPSSVIDARYF